MQARLQKLYPYRWLPVLGLWAAAILVTGLLRLDPYGVEEPAARALLLAWSVTERVISTALVLGLPDLRTPLFIALGLYWPGSIIAAKVFTLMIIAVAAVLLYRWCNRSSGQESALIATGLLLIAPATIAQIDTIGTGPYLLLAFALGRWMDEIYRGAQRPLGGWYFLQLLLILFTVSLHPAGLAYPLALIWEWWKNPVDARQQRHVYIGAGISLIFILILRMGWHALDWWHNPLLGLALGALGPEVLAGESLPWITGSVCAMVLLYLLARERRTVHANFMHRLLLGGVLLGLPAADGGWAMIALATLLYLGIPRLIAFNQSFGGQGLLRQRGLVMAVLFMAATLFMQANKAHHYAAAQNLLPPDDKLIMTLAVELEDTPDTQDIVAMSQWPGKTMLAIKRPTLPLPPAYPDGETLLKNIKGVTHLVFNPFDPVNRSLADNLAKVTGATETLALQEGGVILRIRDSAGNPAPHQPPPD